MYKIAHRCWSEGENDNSIESIKKSETYCLDGVEIDIRFSERRNDLVASHFEDSKDSAESLEVILEYLKNTKFKIILLELKEVNEIIIKKLIFLLEKHSLQKDVVVFGFREVMVEFPWNQKTNSLFGLGIISTYPWKIIKDLIFIKPDYIFFGHDERVWTRVLFKIIFPKFLIFSFIKLFPKTKFILGIARGRKQVDYFKSIKNLTGFTLDKNFD